MVKGVSLIWAFRYLVQIVGVRGWEGIMSVKVLTKIAQTSMCMCGLPCHINFSQQLQDSKVSAAANWYNYPPARIDDAAV